MPATANELFRDGLLRRQIALAKYERGLQSDVLDLLDQTERALRAELEDRLANLEGKAFSSTINSRLNVLENAVRKLRSGAFDEVNSVWDSSMQQLAIDEAAYLDAHLKDVAPVQVDTVMPDPVQLAGIVSVQPVAGRLLSDWAEGLGENDVQRIMDGVRVGMAAGEATDDIVRRVVGSRSLDGADGILQIARRDLTFLTQTAVSTVANTARSAYYEANSDIFSKEQWVATLDDSTCEQCAALDGEEFDIGEGDQPPAHINCRCVRTPVIDGGALGTRPANAAMEDELDGLSKDEKIDHIKELVGQVPSTTTYSEWLGQQTEAFQDHVLGPSRAALFRDGDLPLSRFVNTRGDTYNLDQLRKLEPAAFKRAGL